MVSFCITKPQLISCLLEQAHNLIVPTLNILCQFIIAGVLSESELHLQQPAPEAIHCVFQEDCQVPPIGRILLGYR